MNGDLFLHLQKTFEDHNHDDVDVDAILSSYSFLTYDKPKLVEVALEVLDKQDNHKVVQIVSQSTGRAFHLIQGSQNRKYLVLSHYCPCQSFAKLFNKTSSTMESMLKEAPRRELLNEAPQVCKHILAVSLAHSLHRLDTQVVSDSKYMEMFNLAVG